MNSGLGWLGIVRLGLVQASLGAIVVLTTSTLNRVMVVELALPALLPGALVALHYAVQILRPRFGYGSDVGRRRTPWIIGGMAALSLGGVLAAAATALMATQFYAGIILASVAFLLIGVGVAAAGTSLLALLAKQVDQARRAPAATVVWLSMIAGIAITATVAGHLLDPYSPQRLVGVTCSIAISAFLIALLAVWNVETKGDRPGAVQVMSSSVSVPFRDAFALVWRDSEARYFTVFVFLSMLAFSMQDLILEPFAGAQFGFTPGQSTQLAGVQHAGVFSGMLLVALVAGSGTRARLCSLKTWVIGGCIASGAALLGLALASAIGPRWPLASSVFLLGLANGAFSVAAIGTMMELAGKDGDSRAGIRLGLWGGAQAISFGSGALLGTVAADFFSFVWGSRAAGYGTVFFLEGLLFLYAAIVALQVYQLRNDQKASAENPDMVRVR